MDLIDPGNLRVAKPRSPNITCPCGTRFTWKQVKEITCEYTTECRECGKLLDCFSVNVEVRGDNKHLLYETPRYWWHITERADWAKNGALNDLFVHVGTAQTVRSYHDILVKHRDWKSVFDTFHFITPGFHLYRVELPESLSIDKRIATDQNDWPVELGDWTPEHTAYKYVNSVEVPGSISLLVPYRDLTGIEEVSIFSTRRSTNDKEA